MNMNRKLLFIFSITLPVLILLGMLYTPLITYLKGEEIVIKTVPFDPTDPFRGDYVSLNFEINRVNGDLIDGSVYHKAKENQHKLNIDVYVWLHTVDGVEQVERVSLDKPKHNHYLNGKVFRYDVMDSYSSKYLKIPVEYSLDRYFVPENTGLELEQVAQSGNLYDKVKIYHGYPVIIDTLTSPSGKQ